MSEFAIAAVALVPAVSIGASGIALLRTRSRLAGAMLLATSAGVIAALLK